MNGSALSNELNVSPLLTLTCPWQVSFDPNWEGPATPQTFDKMVAWTKLPEIGIRFYCGSAVYRKQFMLAIDAEVKRSIVLEFGRSSRGSRDSSERPDVRSGLTKSARIDIIKSARLGANDL